MFLWVPCCSLMWSSQDYRHRYFTLASLTGLIICGLLKLLYSFTIFPLDSTVSTLNFFSYITYLYGGIMKCFAGIVSFHVLFDYNLLSSLNTLLLSCCRIQSWQFAFISKCVFFFVNFRTPSSFTLSLHSSRLPSLLFPLPSLYARRSLCAVITKIYSLPKNSLTAFLS